MHDRLVGLDAEYCLHQFDVVNYLTGNVSHWNLHFVAPPKSQVSIVRLTSGFTPVFLPP